MDFNARTLKKTFQINSDFILSNNKEYCIINIDKEEVIIINDVAFNILCQLDGRKNLLYLVKWICNKYCEIENDTLIKDLFELLEQLSQKNVIELVS